MHKIKLILLLILPLSVIGQDLGIIDTKTTKNPAINGTHRISTDGQNLFFRNFFGLSKKIANTDSPTFTGNVKISSLGTGDYVKVGLNGLLYSDNTFASDALSATQSALDLKANITSPTFISDATTPRLKITGVGDIGKGSDLVMGGNSNDLTMHGTGKVILGTGGFQRLVVTNAGNVGVGTTAPVAKFEVSGLAGFRYNDGKQADGKYLRSNSTGVAAWDSVKVSEVFGLNTTYLPINNPTSTGTLTAPTIANSLGANFATTSGNVGIGTASPSTKLSISGAVGINTVAQSLILNNSTGVYSTYQYNGTSVGDIGTGNQALSGGGINDFAFTSRTGNLAFGTGSVEKMRIFNNGRVGIGTTTDAGYLLDVNGTAIVRGTARFQSPSQAGYSELSSNSTGAIYQTNGHSYFYTNASAYDVYFQKYNSTGTNMIIKDSGNIGIGTTTPSQKLHVIGNSSIIGNIGIGTVSPSYRLSVYNSTAGTSLDGIDISVNDATAAVTHSTKLFTQQQGTGAGRTLFYAASNITGATQGQLDILTENGGNFISQLGTAYSGTNSLALYDLAGVVKNNINTNGNSFFNGGNIGIGTTAPTEKLEVFNGNYTNLKISANQQSSIKLNTTTLYGVNNPNAELYNNYGNVGLTLYPTPTATRNDIIYYDNTDKETQFQTDGSTKLRIRGNGNVLIGTPTDAGYKLDVNGTVRAGSTTSQSGALISARNTGNSFEFGHPNQVGYGSTLGANSGNGFSFLAFNAEAGTTNNTFRTRGLNGRIIINDINNNRLQFQRTTSSSADNQTPVVDMTIDGSGNVGIGTTAPSYKLDISGSGIVTQRIVSTDNQANFSLQGTLGQLSNEVGDFYINNNSASGTMIFRVGSTVERMRITSTGNVGIGTNAPAYKLDVAGTGVVTSRVFSSSGIATSLLHGTNGQTYNVNGDYYLTNASATGQIRLQTNSIDRLNIFSNGRVGINTTTDAGYLLDVNGTIRAVNDAYFATTSGNVGIGTALPSAKLHIKNGTDRNLWFRVNGNGTGTELLSINDSEASRQQLAFSASSFYFDVGNVGIGTVAPLTKFHIKRTGVNGAGLASSAIIATDGKTIGDGIGLDFFGHDSGNNEQGYGSFRYTITNPTAGAEASELSITTWNAGANTERIKISSTGNVGIGTSTPNASSVLDITSTTQGVLFPRLTTTQISAISSPADGLTVYNTTLKAICFYDAGAAVWKRVSHSNM